MQLVTKSVCQKTAIIQWSHNMHKNLKVIVVMPAYNAEKTLSNTYMEVMAQGMVDLVVVVDDESHDETTLIAKSLPNTIVHVHEKNRGYGGNQKTCYKIALEQGGDIIIMGVDHHPGADLRADAGVLPQ
ncbi:MAG: glycosyltransferase [Desulfobacterales bacterium]